MENINMLDNIICLDNQKIIAERRLTMTEDVFGDHFPLFPILPGVLLLEMITQSLSVFLNSNQYDTTLKIFFGKIKFQNYARPGDCLKLEVLLKKATKEEYIFSAKIKTNSKLVAKIKEVKIIR